MKKFENKKIFKIFIEKYHVMEDISYNFGAIRDSIIKLSASEILKESKSKTLDSFMGLIKQNSTLHKQHLIFKNLQESKPFEKERLAERFLNQNLQLFANEKWESILAENKKIRRELLDDNHVEAKKDGKLFESINIMLESVTKGPRFNDFEKEQAAYEYIMSHLTRPAINESEVSNEKTDSPKLVGDAWKFITKMAISNFNERFKHLNENEKNTFKILISDNDTKVNYLQALKKENINIIDTKLKNENDNKTVDLLNTFKSKLENIKEGNNSSLDESIIACIELKQKLQ
jgi:phage terminase small subunit